MSEVLLKQEDFQSFIGTQLTVRQHGTILGELRFDEIKELPGDHRRDANGTPCQPFSLLFTSEPALHLAQGTYDFVFDENDARVIFIVPIGPDRSRSGRMCYQAIFN